MYERKFPIKMSLSVRNLNTQTHKHSNTFLLLNYFFYICTIMNTSTFHIASMIRLRQDVKWKIYARELKMYVR